MFQFTFIGRYLYQWITIHPRTNVTLIDTKSSGDRSVSWFTSVGFDFTENEVVPKAQFGWGVSENVFHRRVHSHLERTVRVVCTIHFKYTYNNDKNYIIITQNLFWQLRPWACSIYVTKWSTRFIQVTCVYVNPPNVDNVCWAWTNV